jgi:dTDP-4-amino-4,6-dideoxygalactose transaminase
VIRELRKRQVEAYVHYVCLPATSFYARHCGTSGADTPVALELSHRSITLPLFPAMQRADVDYVAAMLREALSAVSG